MIRTWLPVVAALLVVRGVAVAGCDSPQDLAGLADVRALVAAQCDCANAINHKTYARCAQAVANTAVLDGRLDVSCRSRIVQCAAKSTCGRPGSVTCCRTNAVGITKCSIKKSALTCRAPSGGSACVGLVSSCCDACDHGGCAVPGSTTTTILTTTTTTHATTTTVPTTCGNGQIDPGEQCDPPGAVVCPTSVSGAFDACEANCTCPGGVGPTTTTSPGQTTTTTVPTTTTTSTTLPTLPCTDPLLPLPPLAKLPIDVITGATQCGGPALSPAPGTPTAGELDTSSGSKLTNLGAGCLYVGGGAADGIPPARIPDGSRSIFGVVGLRGSKLILGANAGTGATTCTLGPGPGKHCINGSAGHGGGACSNDGECGGTPGSCARDARCFFGPPIPLPVPSNPALSACVVNVVAADMCGTTDILGFQTEVNAILQARLYLTGNGSSPCPRCVGNVCDGGKNVGQRCTAVGSFGTSPDCPPADTSYLASLLAVAAPLTTETQTRSSDTSGRFCSGQQNPGAFGVDAARRIHTVGRRLNLLDTRTTLAGSFCMPSSGSALVDSATDLPGPGAVSIPGRVSILEVLRLLGL